MNTLRENIVLIWLLPVFFEIILPLAMLLFYLLGKTLSGPLRGEARHSRPVAAGNGQTRITSYNVCYTKLLREADSLFHREGCYYEKKPLRKPRSSIPAAGQDYRQPGRLAGRAR